MFMMMSFARYVLLGLLFMLLLCSLTVVSVQRRRDHRFMTGNRSSKMSRPSAAYTALMTTYAGQLAKGKFFGMVIEHSNSDGSKTPQIILNNNRCMPLVGFGTWQLGNNYTTNKRTIHNAIDAGYRLIDTAYIYGTEEAIGDALQEQFASGKLKREDVFVTTKVWPTYFSKPKVMASIGESLRKLKLKYLDLILLHYPTGFKQGADNYPKYANGSIIPRTWRKDSYLETWQAMEDAARLGLTGSIGVSNFNRVQMRKLLKAATIKPVINQVESNPVFNQERLRQYLWQNQVLMQAYAPIRRADKELLQSATLQQIGQKHGKSSAQVALRWQLDRAVPIVVKSSNPTRMASNIDLFDFRLSRAELNTILAMKQKPRIYNIPGIEKHPDYPFNEK